MKKLYNCRFHPTNWWHEVGCPHMKWTRKEKRNAKREYKKFGTINIRQYGHKIS